MSASSGNEQVIQSYPLNDEQKLFLNTISWGAVIGGFIWPFFNGLIGATILMLLFWIILFGGLVYLFIFGANSFGQAGFYFIVWQVLLYVSLLVNLIIWVYLFANGKKVAWYGGQRSDFNHFITYQKNLLRGIVIFYVIMFIVLLIASFLLGDIIIERLFSSGHAFLLIN